MNNNFLVHFKGVNDVVGTIVKEIKRSNSKLLLFGAGYCVSMVLDLCTAAEIEVYAIVDNDQKKWNGQIRGINIISWQEVLLNNMKYPILISTSHIDEILKQIRDSNYEEQVFCFPEAAYYKNSIYDLAYVENNQERFNAAYESLADQVSKEVFLGVIKHNISLDNRYYEEIEKYEINGYFGTDLYENKREEVIVDAGAFNGDTIKEFMNHDKFLYKKIYAFEPDVNNFNLLLQNVYGESKVVPVCAGLGKECNKLRFSMGGGVSSRIDDEGETVVDIETIDHYFTEEIPTFIKMDIEGAEKAALIGGKNIIKKYKPTLAVSAYHKAEDLFELIEVIRNLGKEYTIYLRHTFFYQSVKIQPDVIIYALKGEKK